MTFLSVLKQKGTDVLSRIIGLAFALIVMISVGPMLTACSTLPTNGAAVAVARSAVQVSTVAVIEGVKERFAPDVQKARAQRLVAVAGEVQTWLTEPSVTVSGLRGALNLRLDKLDLTPADKLLISDLVNTVALNLQAQTSTEDKQTPLTADQLYQLSTVLSWAIDVAKLY